MIQKNYTFTDINNLLKNYNFKSVFKKKMPFGKLSNIFTKTNKIIIY